jgi:transcriptional regulator GlxA family with amidase domain
MREKDKILRVALLAVTETTGSTLYGMYDLFSSVGRDWSFLMEGVPGEQRIKPQVVALNGEGFAAANGVWIKPDCSLERASRPDILCIPELLVAPGADLSGCYRQEIDWIRWCYAGGTVLATVCSGALMPAEAGLLDGQDVTSHWGYCDALSVKYPSLRVHPHRALVVSGEGSRIVMAGGGTSWQDLALFLIARFVGIEEAMQVARVYLIDWHDMGQQPFAALTCTRQVEDGVISDCQVWLAEHYDQLNPVAAMVERSGLTERSFNRRFAQATGMSPMEYLHTLRLEEAKQILETTNLSIDAVANEVGYAESSFFGRLFRRKVGITPAQYRKRFGSLRKAIEAGAG